MNINYHKTNYTWGIESLDRRFGKPWDRELIILYWYSSCGKTEFSFFTALKNAEKWNKVLYISLELPEYDMKLRIARKKAGINKYQFQMGDYTDNQKLIMEQSFEKLNNTENIIIKSPQDKSLRSIQLLVEEYASYGYWMIFIDNLDKISYQTDNDNIRYQKVTATLQDIKNDKNLCIILIHHAKKPENKWTIISPAGLQGMRGSQKIMDNCTQLFELFREIDPDETDDFIKSRVTLIQMKDTFEWAVGKEDLFFYKSSYYDENWYKDAKYNA